MNPSAINGDSTILPAEGSEHHFIIRSQESGQRLDRYLSRKLSEISRSSITKLIQAGNVAVDGQKKKSGHKVKTGEAVQVALPEVKPSQLEAEDIAFDVLFEDSHLLVISKPPGLVVHPAAGNQSGTLVNGLLYHYQDLPQIDGGRPGIVHRLDKDTSGVMVIAKSEQALRQLAEDFKERRVHKTYQAILLRSPADDYGTINAPIGRHPVQRKKMAVRPLKGRYAVSHWEVLERYANGMCLAGVAIETGRTHQIRVHMAANTTPIVGDELYGGKPGAGIMDVPARQMLHAYHIALDHPVDRRPVAFTAPLWEDMDDFLALLREQAA